MAVTLAVVPEFKDCSVSLAVMYGKQLVMSRAGFLQEGKAPYCNVLHRAATQRKTSFDKSTTQFNAT